MVAADVATAAADTLAVDLAVVGSLVADTLVADLALEEDSALADQTMSRDCLGARSIS